MRQKIIQLPQGQTLDVVFTPTIEGVPLSSLNAAIFLVYTFSGTTVLTKSLGNGITFEDGIVKIALDSQDTLNFSGSHKFDCLLGVTAEGPELFPMRGIFDVLPTKARIT